MADSRVGTRPGSRGVRIATVAVLVGGGVAAALANFVLWPVAVVLGGTAGAAGWYGELLRSRWHERQVREAAWRAAVSADPVGASGEDDVLGWLHPVRRLVAYSPAHESVLRQVVRWVDGAGPITEPVLVVDGPPGSGKTRLLVELADRLDVRCGWVPVGRGMAALSAAAAMEETVVMIVDDADTRQDVAAMIAAFAEMNDEWIRLVFAARDSDSWWRQIRTGLDSPVLARLPYRPKVTLPLITGSTQNQQQMFTRALRSFLPASPPKVTVAATDPPPSVLMLHAAAAWAAAAGATGVVDSADVAESLLELESNRWRVSAEQAGLADLPAATMGRAVLLAALVGAGDANRAQKLLAGVLEPAGSWTSDRAGAIADWLRGLYPQIAPDWLRPYLPAVLLERWASQALARDTALVEAMVTSVAHDDDRARRMTTILARATRHSPSARAAITKVLCAAPFPMAAAAITAAWSTGAPLDNTIATAIEAVGTRLNAAQLEDLYQRIPDPARPHLLASVSLTLLRQRLRLLDNDDPDILPVREDLAIGLEIQGRYLEAEAEYRILLDVRTARLGAEHPDTLRTRHACANMLRDRRLSDEAEAEYQAVLVTQTRILGAEHSDTLKTRHSHAGALQLLGRYAEAEAQYEIVLDALTRLLGADHFTTLETRHDRAMVLRRAGRSGEARVQYEAVLDAQTRHLGTEHPTTLNTRHSRADVLNDLGHYIEAEAEYQTVLNIQTRLLGAEHPDTLGTRHGRANTLRLLGRSNESRSEYVALLDLRTRLLGAEHPDTLNIRHSLALVLQDQGHYNEARTQLQIVFDVRSRLLGAEHPDTVGARHGHAIALHLLGHHAEAEAEYQIVLNARTNLLGAEHPTTLDTRHNRAAVLQKLGRSDEANAEYRIVLDLRTSLLGADHPDTLKTRRNLDANRMADTHDT